MLYRNVVPRPAKSFDPGISATWLKHTVYDTVYDIHFLALLAFLLFVSQ